MHTKSFKGKIPEVNEDRVVYDEIKKSKRFNSQRRNN